MEIIKIRINNELINISVTKIKCLKDREQRSKMINKYKRFLTKLNQKK